MVVSLRTRYLFGKIEGKPRILEPGEEVLVRDEDYFSIEGKDPFTLQSTASVASPDEVSVFTRRIPFTIPKEDRSSIRGSIKVHREAAIRGIHVDVGYPLAFLGTIRELDWQPTPIDPSPQRRK